MNEKLKTKIKTALPAVITSAVVTAGVGVIGLIMYNRYLGDVLDMMGGELDKVTTDHLETIQKLINKK